MIAMVDPRSGDTRAHSDLPDATDSALLDWLASEMDGDLLDLLHRFLARAKGYPQEQPSTNIDLDVVEGDHLVGLDELFEGVRSDEYLLANHRHWAGLFLCPMPGCDCREAHVVFFDEETESGDAVGSVLLDLGGNEGFEVQRTSPECGAPDDVVRQLWSLFERRHQVGPYLRRREARFKAVGQTLCRPVAKPVRAVPSPGRNEPCPCGSGRKFKKCCLGKSPSLNGPRRKAQ